MAIFKPNNLTMLALLIGIVYLQTRIWFGDGSFAHVSALQSQLDHRIEDNELKRTRNRLLKAEILDLREGLDAVEEKARADFGLIKEGETFLLLIDQ
jgi:cell division protein FtsB